MGAEPKPPWRAVPTTLRQWAETTLGARVERALRIWGGYAPSATFRLFLGDGRRVVFKAAYQSSNEVLLSAIRAEERVYRELGPRLSRWAPAFYGAVDIGDWVALLLEDVGPARIPPWNSRAAAAALRDYANFHIHNLRVADWPGWVPREAHHAFARGWRILADSDAGLDGAASLAGERRAEARAWLARHIDLLQATAEQLIDAPAPHTLLHFDTRSDNLRIQPGGQLRMFDWPYARVAPAELDVAYFVQTIATEGGPPPEQCLRWYGERLEVREAVLNASIATAAGFFAHRACQPPIPGLPRVRGIQRRQLRVSLSWCAERLDLEPPTWLAAVQD